MSSLKVIVGLIAAGVALSGCMPATTYQAAPEASLKPNDKAQLAKARYAAVSPPEPFRRAIVDYHRKELPGTIVVDSDNHYLYMVQDGGKAIRYGVTVGEEAQAWSGVAKVGNKQEWPAWIPAMPWFVAIPLALLLVTAIGFIQGKIITFFQLPAFVVTLAGFLVWSGVVLIMIGGAGTVIIQDKTVLGIANSFLPPILGWIVGIAFVAFVAIAQILELGLPLVRLRW